MATKSEWGFMILTLVILFAYLGPGMSVVGQPVPFLIWLSVLVLYGLFKFYEGYQDGIESDGIPNE